MELETKSRMQGLSEAAFTRFGSDWIVLPGSWTVSAMRDTLPAAIRLGWGIRAGPWWILCALMCLCRREVFSTWQRVWIC